jgi:hypothetical protein
MKTLLTMATALAFAAGLAGHADAGPRKKKRVYQQSYSKYYPRAYRYRDDGYYEQRLEAQRFGSQRWWQVYERQRGPRG